MDVILLVIIPLALLKDVCWGGDAADDLKKANRQKKSGMANAGVTAIAICCCCGLFVVDAFIFNTYIKKGSLGSLTDQA